jgi:uridylate kinase
MIGQHFGENTDTPEFVTETDQDTPSTTAELAEEAESAPVLTTEIQQVQAVPANTPVSQTNAEEFARLTPVESENLRMRWNDIQGKFVDEPGTAVMQADALVSEVVEKITRVYTDEHNALKSQWRDDNNVSTEDLRQTLQRYRSFFNRLVV